MAEEVEIMDTTEEVAENQVEDRPTSEEVAREESVAEMDHKADRVQQRVAC